MDTATQPAIHRGLPDEQPLSQPDRMVAVKIDVARMAGALASQTITPPNDMSREEKRQFIIQQAT